MVILPEHVGKPTPKFLTSVRTSVKEIVKTAEHGLSIAISELCEEAFEETGQSLIHSLKSVCCRAFFFSPEKSPRGTELALPQHRNPQKGRACFPPQKPAERSSLLPSTDTRRKVELAFSQFKVLGEATGISSISLECIDINESPYSVST